MGGSVSFGSSSLIYALVEVPAGSSASEVTAELQSENFSVSIIQSTKNALEDSSPAFGAVSRVHVSVQPLAFTTTTSKRMPTTTTVRLTTIAETGTTPEAEGSTTRESGSGSTQFLSSSLAAPSGADHQLSAALRLSQAYTAALLTLAARIHFLALAQ